MVSSPKMPSLMTETLAAYFSELVFSLTKRRVSSTTQVLSKHYLVSPSDMSPERGIMAIPIVQRREGECVWREGGRWHRVTQQGLKPAPSCSTALPDTPSGASLQVCLKRCNSLPNKLSACTPLAKSPRELDTSFVWLANFRVLGIKLTP